jgi:endonuclease/exonuclease/phosphatase family metal-dependent hydrolase
MLQPLRAQPEHAAIIDPLASGGLTAPVDPDVLHIASYNIHRCVGTDLRSDPNRVAKVILELGCDTIGLQEVDSRPSDRSDSMQLDYLAQATAMQAVPGSTLIRHDGEYGNALLTRRRILDVKRHDLSYGRYEPRGALEVDLEVQGKPMRVFVMHLGLMPSERRFQMRKVLQELRRIPPHEPVVVLGDMNEWLPLGRPLRWLHSLLGKPPWQRTFPVWAPLFALDRVWVRPVGSMLDFNVHRSPAARRASDHFPVTARVLPAAVPLRERAR